MDTDQIATLLAKTELFGGLDPDTCREVARNAPLRQFAKGQTIFVQDEPGDRLYVVARGVVRLLIRSSRGEVIELGRRGPPGIFGEVAVLDGGPRSASAEAVGAVTLVTVTRNELIRLLRAEYRVVDAVLKSLGALVRRANQQTTDLAFLDLPGRLARRLLELEAVPGAGEQPRRVTQTELAQMVGGARQSVNLALHSLEARGLIRVQGGAIQVLRREELRRRADR